MTTYAARTEVSVEKSRAEIESVLNRYGATAFAYASGPGHATIVFECKARRIRFDLPLPDRNDKRFLYAPARRSRRTDAEAYREWEQACRQKWRALALAIKAKLEAVESGISQFEEEFLAHIVLPGGQTVGRWMLPQIATAYQSGNMPPLLEGPRQ